MGHYDVAQVCPNGHVATSSFQSFPQFRKEYCSSCGEKTFIACAKCGKNIEGHYVGSLSLDPFIPPSFCKYCGQEFPWVERKRQAAYEMFIDEIQEEEDRKLFQESMEQISKDTPQAQVASNRIVRLLKKVSAGTAKAIKDIVVQVATEAVKKGIVG